MIQRSDLSSIGVLGLLVLSMQACSICPTYRSEIMSVSHTSYPLDEATFDEVVSGMHGASFDAVRDRVGQGVSLSPSETQRILDSGMDPDIFPLGVLSTDTFSGYVIRHFPRQLVYVLQFRDDQLIHLPSQSAFLLSRRQHTPVDGDPWYIVASYQPGIGTELSWTMLLDGAGMGVIQEGHYGDVVCFDSRQQKTLWANIESQEFADLSENYGARVPSGSKRILCVFLGGEEHLVSVWGWSESQESNDELAVFERIWGLLMHARLQARDRGQPESAD